MWQFFKKLKIESPFDLTEGIYLPEQIESQSLQEIFVSGSQQHYSQGL